jgi:hypothetical protein
MYYDFEDLFVEIDGLEYLVTGRFHVSWCREDAQPDCGYPGGIEITDYEDWEYSFTDLDGEPVSLPFAEPRFVRDAIICAIDESNIVDEIDSRN